MIVLDVEFVFYLPNSPACGRGNVIFSLYISLLYFCFIISFLFKPNTSSYREIVFFDSGITMLPLNYEIVEI